MATAEQLQSIVDQRAAFAYLLEGRALAQQLYFTLNDTLARAAAIAAKQEHPVLQGDGVAIADELKAMMAKAIAFKTQLDTDHKDMLTWVG